MLLTTKSCHNSCNFDTDSHIRDSLDGWLDVCVRMFIVFVCVFMLMCACFVLQCVCACMCVKVGQPGRKKDDYWEPAKKKLLVSMCLEV